MSATAASPDYQLSDYLEAVQLWLQDHALLAMAQVYRVQTDRGGSASDLSHLGSSLSPAQAQRITYPSDQVSYWETYLYSRCLLTFISGAAELALSAQVPAEQQLLQELRQTGDPALGIIYYAQAVLEKSESLAKPEQTELLRALKLLATAAQFEQATLSGELPEIYYEQLQHFALGLASDQAPAAKPDANPPEADILEADTSPDDTQTRRILAVLDRLPWAVKVALDTTFGTAEVGANAALQFLAHVQDPAKVSQVFPPATGQQSATGQRPAEPELPALPPVPQARAACAQHLRACGKAEDQFGLLALSASVNMARQAETLR